ncbi:MAG: hypothetical protein JWQ65_2559, partial [Devosia sp.]|nr:hypothetical protein [Devosia sp.]
GEKLSALLHAASKAKDTAAIEFLLANKADTSLADDFGDTAADYVADNEALAGTNAADLLK